MKKRKIGSLEVSEIGMGCMGFSHGYGKVPEESYSIEAIRMAYESLGCTFFDTAETYGREQFSAGHNERLVGKALQPFRGDVVLATKFHINDEEDGWQTDLEGYIRRHLEQSMENLRTDYIDLYYLHRMHEQVPAEAVAEIMGKLIREGKIRAWGLSQVEKDTLMRAHEVTPVAAVQNLYSMIERDCEKEIFPYCLENGIGVVAFSPIGSGLLSGRITAETKFSGDDVRRWVPQLQAENLEGGQAIVDLLAGFAERKGVTSAQISLAWMMKKYANAVPIPGSRNRERIAENLLAAVSAASGHGSLFFTGPVGRNRMKKYGGMI